MLLLLQNVLYCLLYASLIKCAVRNDGRNCLYFYPKEYYEGIIFPTYFIEKRMKICQKKDVIQFRNYRRYWESADRQSINLLKKKEFRWIQLDGGKFFRNSITPTPIVSLTVCRVIKESVKAKVKGDNNYEQ